MKQGNITITIDFETYRAANKAIQEYRKVLEQYKDTVPSLQMPRQAEIQQMMDAAQDLYDAYYAARTGDDVRVP